MNKFYYASLIEPQQIQLGTIMGEIIYCNCAECGEVNAIIHGQIKDSIDHMMAYLKNDDGITMTAACYCEACFERIAQPWSKAQRYVKSLGRCKGKDTQSYRDRGYWRVKQ